MNPIIIVPLTTALVSLIKGVELMNKKYMPIVGVAIGILVTSIATFAAGTTFNPWSVILEGLINGLGSVGLYEIGKPTGVNDKMEDMKEKFLE